MIVLDDIWEQIVMETITDALPNAMNGSRLLIITRLQSLADPRSTPYEPSFLSDEESWELFLKVVFPSDKCHTKLSKGGGGIGKGSCEEMQ